MPLIASYQTRMRQLHPKRGRLTGNASRAGKTPGRRPASTHKSKIPPSPEPFAYPFPPVPESTLMGCATFRNSGNLPPLYCWWLASAGFLRSATHTCTRIFQNSSSFVPADAKAARASAHLFQLATCSDVTRDRAPPASPSSKAQNLPALQNDLRNRDLLIREKAIAPNAPNLARLGWARL